MESEVQKAEPNARELFIARRLINDCGRHCTLVDVANVLAAYQMEMQVQFDRVLAARTKRGF